MIIPNGTVKFKMQTATTGIDPETGYPVKASSSWSEPMPCQYIVKSLDRLAEAMGNPLTKQSYDIYVEDMPIASERLILTDYRKGAIGEFSIRSIEPLDAVCQVKISI